ncbi:PREDICTED: serine--pyruvate aminotransferase, mitochondrial [Wasmannia auropunctata]|uniref:serine--pyruvate aminotransferase, mitochondrial n=1 Tax=Wasmannia auropunctata TaxID=64793 RepID=UPI0005EED47E|nr:PREDICTED: serine--pyruvate aminotransferase, mitochondrial [Wasmannia auropunctata]XP_011692593.1 PREDICTED: serine--pyruvate aminotransferase, mitochondrial [Wasmannia auropunctata]XP_011692594.1 PREDICTED: serine--pyruvate aminotransferase, mitochondrial [Wasmannia auropunctata]
MDDLHIWRRCAVQPKPPKEILRPVSPPVKVLTGPGPSNCSDEVLRSLGQQVLGHLHPEICQLMDDIKMGSQYAFQTRNRLTLALSTSGHGGMEACLDNLLEPGETVLIAKCGLWGERAADMAGRIGANIKFLETAYGVPFDLVALNEALSKHRPAAVFVTHGESSTGMKQPLEGVGKLVHKYEALLIVDTVASLGGEPFFMDAWEVDAVYTGSQKVLGAPAGLSPVSFSPRAERKIFRATNRPAYYWDMRILGDYWNCFGAPRRAYHHTISATLVYGLRTALMQLAEEGLTTSWARHAAMAVRFRQDLRALGLESYIEDPRHQLSTVISIKVPPGIDADMLVARTMEKYKIEISGGLGPTVGKIWRVGLMGVNARTCIVNRVIAAFHDGLQHALKAKM